MKSNYTLNYSDTEIQNLDFFNKVYNLEELYLNGCQIDNLFFPKSLQSLKSLELIETTFYNYRDFANLKNLRKLDLTGAGLFDLKEINLTGLISLEELIVQKSGVNKIKGLDTLLNLKSFDAHFTKISNISDLGKLPKLEQVDLCYADINTDDLESLKKCKKLKWLDISNTNICSDFSIQGVDIVRSTYLDEYQEYEKGLVVSN